VSLMWHVCRPVASVSTPKNHTEGAPGPSLLGTGETPDLHWQEEAHGLAGTVPANAAGNSDLHRDWSQGSVASQTCR
jgi:hypothetical protein